jgi:hypothetical protein
MRLRRGQAILESMLMVLMLCLLAGGLYQLALVFVAKDVLMHSAHSAARAKTVGFNSWMVEKCGRVAAIPNAGLITVPTIVPTPVLQPLVASLSPGRLWDTVLGMFPVSEQTPVEMARIPEYLASDYPLQGHYVLDYADWNTVSVTIPDPTPGLTPSPSAPMMQATAEQNFSLRVPMHTAFWAADNILLNGESHMETHYDLYIEDHDW